MCLRVLYVCAFVAVLHIYMYSCFLSAEHVVLVNPGFIAVYIVASVNV